MQNFFSFDSKFFRMMNKVADAFYASVLWLLFCIPVVTIGASTTAFYYTVHKSLRRSRGYIWSNFWHAFKENFKKTTIVWLVMFALLVLLYADRQISFQLLMQNSPLGILYYAFYVFMMFWIMWFIYLFTYAARFENSIKAILKNAAIMVLLHLPWSIVLLVLSVAGAMVVYLSPPTILFVPAGIACLFDLILEKIFRKYMSAAELKQLEEDEQMSM